MFNKRKQCRHGELVYNINDQFVGRSLDLYGEFSEGEVSLFQEMVKPHHIVLDVGANIGAHTLWFAQHCRVVHAFEPQRIVFQTLCANMALNSVTNAFCHRAAVGDVNGFLNVPCVNPERDFNFGGLSVEGHPEGELTPMITVDDLMIPGCDFLKIDVEGMEEKVLIGAEQTIRKYRPVLYVENDRKEKSAALIQRIKSLDYEIEPHSPPLFNRGNYAKNTANVFGNIVSENMLCWHKSWN